MLVFKIDNWLGAVGVMFESVKDLKDEDNGLLSKYSDMGLNLNWLDETRCEIEISYATRHESRHNWRRREEAVSNSIGEQMLFVSLLFIILLLLLLRDGLDKYISLNPYNCFLSIKSVKQIL
jgi:hypothetical protein